jgi:hydrogenase nickel incorporation protein HypB
MEIKVMKNVLEDNDKTAQENREKFQDGEIFTVNLMGSPGAGKTTLLEVSLEMLKKSMKPAVIEGDLSTAKDAQRIAAHGVPVIQINTGGGCHLDAQMIDKVLPGFNMREIDLMVIENVGNLICPVDFDLGEDIRVVVLSIAEGEDKPVKYPRTFMEADAVIINKVDLAPYCDVNLEGLIAQIKNLNPQTKIFCVSCREKKGIEPWVSWLTGQVQDKKFHA